MDMCELVYQSPIEDTRENFEGWDKETFDYLANNMPKIHRWIVKASYSKNGNHPIKLNTADKEDIISELTTYLYYSEDYNPIKACERSKGEKELGIEGYMYNCVKNCTKRYISKMYNINCNLVKETTISQDDREVSLLDSIVDQHAIEDFDKIGYKIDDICRSYECYRYVYGADIFLLLYIKLLTLHHEEKYQDILYTLGISKADLGSIKKKDNGNEIFMAMVKCISICGIDLALPILEKYVYNAQQIKKAVKALI